MAFAPYPAGLDLTDSPDIIPQEFSFFGSGDFRASALRLCGPDGTGVTDFVYQSHRILNGRKELKGLPMARADQDTQTLEITLYDAVTQCRLQLCYTVFPSEDVISRYIVLHNLGKHKIKIEKCMSMVLDMERSDLDMISFYGRPPFEFQYQRVPLHHGVQSILSRRGASSGQYNPFLALCTHRASEESGEVYGFHFVYSGSFLNEVEVDQLNHTRVMSGLGGECFSYILDSDETFFLPKYY